MATIHTVLDLFERAASRYHARPMLRARRGERWLSQTFGQWRADSQRWARGLIAAGLVKGDRVAILGRTSPEWLKADFAVQLAGGVTVPVYPSLPADEAAFIIDHSEARWLICDEDHAGAVAKMIEGLPHLQQVVVYQSVARGADVGGALERWQHIQALASAGEALSSAALHERAAATLPADPCTFVYTSGTTGPPKGVVLSHGAVVFEVRALVEQLDLRDGDATLLFLPLAHIFERIVSLVCLFRGVELIFPSSLDALFEELLQTRPTVIPSVPRVFELFMQAVVERARRQGPVQERALRWALQAGLQVARLKQRGDPVPNALRLRHAVAKATILDSLPKRLGGKVRYCISGGAPLDPKVAEFFECFGVPIVQGYGLTESTAAATVNRIETRRAGTVGQALPGTEIALASDGEILIRGPHLMSCYYRDPEATAAVLPPDGWLRTGDLGDLDADGFLRIRGRKKELIVTASGKNIAPQNIERHLQSHPVVSRAVVFGDRREFLSALITVDEVRLRAWADTNGLHFTCYEEISQLPGVYKMVEVAIEQKNRGLASYETIKKFAVLETPMTAAAGDLTPTMKVRRGAIAEKYAPLLDSFYHDGY